MNRPSIIVVAFAVFSSTATASLYGESNLNHTCALIEPVLSCSAGALPNLTDSCCTETFGGLVLATQLWNTWTGYESQGQVLPKDSWTVHGLWPDFCNGSFTQYCDLSRQFDPSPAPNTTNGKPDGTPVPPYTGPGIETLMQRFGRQDLTAWMAKYWVAQGQPNGDFWAHEFSKHATCYSTFDTACYGPAYVTHEEIPDFFATAAVFHRTLLPATWARLSAAGIRPSNHTRYSLVDIQTALTTTTTGSSGGGSNSSSQHPDQHHRDPAPYLGCSGPPYNETDDGKGSSDAGLTRLSEVWYFHHVLGRPQDLRASRVPADVAGGKLSNCAKAKGAIWYYERAVGSEA